MIKLNLFELLLSEDPGALNKLTYCDDKGHYGEYLAKYALGSDSIEGYSKLICNSYVPYRGKTSEIDLILIHEKGIYVFESKNYSGWIFGSEEQHTWTQFLNSKTKYRFYNPIMQNETHISALSSFLNIPREVFRSYILFSDRCELKKVPANCERYIIIHRGNLLKYLCRELKSRSVVYQKEDVDNLYNALYPLTQISREDKKRHMESIKK